MTEQEQQEHLAMMRRAAEMEIAATSEGRRALIDEHSAAFRWLVASLLAVNGGAAIATLSADGVPALAKLVACSSYYVGVVFALLTAWHSQRTVRAMLQPMGKMTGYWIGVAQSGVHYEIAKQEIDREIAAAMKKSFWTQLFGWCSAASFTIGAFSTGAMYLFPQSICAENSRILSPDMKCVVFDESANRRS